LKGKSTWYCSLLEGKSTWYCSLLEGKSTWYCSLLKGKSTWYCSLLKGLQYGQYFLFHKKTIALTNASDPPISDNQNYENRGSGIMAKYQIYLL
jgi:hypothetical protein